MHAMNNGQSLAVSESLGMWARDAFRKCRMKELCQPDKLRVLAVYVYASVVTCAILLLTLSSCSLETVPACKSAYRTILYMTC